MTIEYKLQSKKNIFANDHAEKINANATLKRYNIMYT